MGDGSGDAPPTTAHPAVSGGRRVGDYELGVPEAP
jgi:hypothetical protein